MQKIVYFLIPCAVMAFAGTVVADDDGRRDGREYKQEYWDGDCKVKRERKKDGEYKEERECKGGRHARYDGGREYKQEYWDGNCKVKREAKKDGEYKEERECKGGRRHARDAGSYAREGRVYYPEQPVYREPEPGVRIDVRVR